MCDKNNTKNNHDKFAWNDAMILDKIQEILKERNIDELEFTDEELETIKKQLLDNLTSEEINQSAYIVAKNIEELKVNSGEDIKDYIIRLKKYLDSTTFKCLKAEYNGVEFEIHNNSTVDEIFKDYYAKYDELYGISEMLHDLGLK